MRSLYSSLPTTTLIPNSNPHTSLTPTSLVLYFPISLHPIQPRKHSLTVLKSQSHPNPLTNGYEDEEEEEDPDGQNAQVEDLRVPDHWLDPSKALEVLTFSNFLHTPFSSSTYRICFQYQFTSLVCIAFISFPPFKSSWYCKFAMLDCWVVTIKI